MCLNPWQYVVEVGAWIDLQMNAGLNHAQDCRCRQASTGAAQEHPVLASNNQGLYGPLSQVIFNHGIAVAQECAQVLPAFAYTHQGRPEF